MAEIAVMKLDRNIKMDAFNIYMQPFVLYGYFRLLRRGIINERQKLAYYFVLDTVNVIYVDRWTGDGNCFPYGSI